MFRSRTLHGQNHCYHLLVSLPGIAPLTPGGGTGCGGGGPRAPCGYGPGAVDEKFIHNCLNILYTKP